MLAVVVRERQVSFEQLPVPEPGPGEVRVRVEATAVNRADLMQVAGLYPPPPGASQVLGLEAAGTVEAHGPGVTAPHLGARVAALLSGGGYAEQVVVRADHLLPVPDGLAWPVAAALPEALCTVWTCFDVGRAARGERWLVHAGGSGIGTTFLGAARVLGLRCFVTASPDKLDRCRALGAEGAADRHGDWVAAVKRWAPGGVDGVLDPIAGPSLGLDQQVLAVGGRIVVLGLMGGASATIDAGRLLVKRQQILGTVLRSRDDLDKARIVAGVARDLWPAVLAGELRPVIERVLPMTEASAAHAALASDRTFGKVVLTVARGQS